MSFEIPIERSSWIALHARLAHTNPIFVHVGGQPVASRRSGLVPEGRRSVLVAEVTAPGWLATPRNAPTNMPVPATGRFSRNGRRTD